jgi:hypothetical protein
MSPSFHAPRAAAETKKKKKRKGKNNHAQLSVFWSFHCIFSFFLSLSSPPPALFFYFLFFISFICCTLFSSVSWAMWDSCTAELTGAPPAAATGATAAGMLSASEDLALSCAAMVWISSSERSKRRFAFVRSPPSCVPGITWFCSFSRCIVSVACSNLACSFSRLCSLLLTSRCTLSSCTLSSSPRFFKAVCRKQPAGRTGDEERKKINK